MRSECHPSKIYTTTYLKQPQLHTALPTYRSSGAEPKPLLGQVSPIHGSVASKVDNSVGENPERPRLSLLLFADASNGFMEPSR